MHFSAKCNSGRIAIQWFHIKHYLDYQYTKFQPYTFRVQKMCVFARYATLVPRLFGQFSFKTGYNSRRSCHCVLEKAYEPVHEISNNVVCATSKASDQPAHTRSLIRAFASCLSIL